MKIRRFLGRSPVNNERYYGDKGTKIRNLGTYYFLCVAPWDWTAPSNGNLWQDGSKTLFDPCPAGWRVPKGGTGDSSAWRDFTVDNGPWQGTGITNGRTWNQVIHNGTAWYSPPGYRRHDNNEPALSGVTLWIHAWTTGTESQQSYSFRTSQGEFTINYMNPHSRGFPVRCLRE